MPYPSGNRLLFSAAMVGGVLLAGCDTVNRPAATPYPAGSTPAATPNPAPPPAVGAAAAPAPAAARPPASTRPGPSGATNAKAYRRDAASHLYAINAERIYKGQMQPNLYAIGVLDVDIDRQGNVTAVTWRRAPSHVPEVMAEIVRTVRAAAPYPVPSRLGRVTYTDIWLWDKSGKFQLDTLTEGQL